MLPAVISVALAGSAVMAARARHVSLGPNPVMTRAAATHAPVWVTANTAVMVETVWSATRAFNHQ